MTTGSLRRTGGYDDSLPVLVSGIGLLGKIRDVYAGYRLDVEMGWFDRLIDCATQLRNPLGIYIAWTSTPKD